MVAPADVVTRFFAIVESRDAAAVAECLTPDAVFRNMPHDPVVGRAAIRATLQPILSRSSRVRWDVHNLVTQDRLVFAERTDRFWIDGREYAIECNGIFRVHEEHDLIAEMRDYVDLGVWRRRLGDVLGPDRSEPA